MSHGTWTTTGGSGLATVAGVAAAAVAAGLVYEGCKRAALSAGGMIGDLAVLVPTAVISLAVGGAVTFAVMKYRARHTPAPELVPAEPEWVPVREIGPGVPVFARPAPPRAIAQPAASVTNNYNFYGADATREALAALQRQQQQQHMEVTR